MNPLLQLSREGQSYWLDSLSRAMIRDGSLRRRVDEEGLSGVTSNPAIFHKAISGAPEYDAQIAEGARAGRPVARIYRDLVVTDVREACDLLAPVHERTAGRDGFVSLEVSPHLAHDEGATLEQARALAAAVDRPNLFIKVPGTPEGLPAIEQLLYEGININITLLFGLETYAQVLEAHLRALERRRAEGRSVSDVASVASFFLSRIDVLVDRLLGHRIHEEVSEAIRARAESQRGRAAVASAKLAYRHFREVLAGERWQRLAADGAAPQKIVWASTGNKSPAYPELMYVESLIGPDTVSTMPEKTLAAFAEHGQVAPTAGEGVDEARDTLQGLASLGIDLEAVSRQLVDEGVRKFIEPYDALMESLAGRAQAFSATPPAEALAAMARTLRRDTLRMTTAAGSGHATSCLSAADLVAALFFGEMRWDPTEPRARDVDSFVLSKGHAAPLLWAALHRAGAIDEDPMSLRRIDSTLEGHPTPRNPWVRVATGSLGQGLAAANGMALANRMDGLGARIFCLLGDGECSEGSVWEAAQFAGDNRLSGLVALVDMNGIQQSQAAPYGHDTSVYARRFQAFGWDAVEIDGHDMAAVVQALRASRDNDRPTAVIARTVKGKGVSLLEGAQGWHGKPLDEPQLEQALAELGQEDIRLQVVPRRLGGTPAPAPEPSPAIAVSYERGEEVATRAAFGEALRKLGAEVPGLVVIDGDVKNSTKTEAFGEAFPDRLIESHIAEQNMVGTALGMAVSGYLPCVATFAAFLSRAYDFIRMAGHSHPEHLIFCGSHAGVSIGEDGPSQMGLEDIAMFRAIDGSTILYPCDAVSAERLTEQAVLTPGIVYIRTTRGKTPVIYDNGEAFPVGGSRVLRSSAQDRLTLVAAGVALHAALDAHERLRERGIPTRVIDAYSVKPLDVETLQRAARETEGLIVVEDHSLYGGLGDAVSAEVGRIGRVFRMGVTGEPRSGTPEELMDRHRISGRAIEQEALAVAA